MSERDTPRISAYVRGIGLLGPGLDDWPSAAEVLTGQRAHVPAPTLAPAPASLPPAERRRTGATVRLALAAGREAVAGCELDVAGLATVFAASGGDGTICHEICSALASPERQMSPTRFHNSVHNAASGYWSIAAQATAPSTALCAYDGSFVAGLLEALTQLRWAHAPVLLVAYDTAYPEPLHAKRPLPAAFAVALLLEPRPVNGVQAQLDVELTFEPADVLACAPLEALRSAVPAARSLPLLEHLARGDSSRVVLDYLDDLRLAVKVSPCP